MTEIRVSFSCLKFFSRDPLFETSIELGIESGNELALCAFAKNNPLKYKDPTGLRSDDGSTMHERRIEWEHKLSVVQKYTPGVPRSRTVPVDSGSRGGHGIANFDY